MTFRDVGRRLIVALLLSAMPFGTINAVETSPAQDQRIINLKTKGAAEIDRRLASLEAASAQLQTNLVVEAADKNAVTSQIRSEISALTALKTKLQAETSLTEARGDVANIVTGYRVYTLILPKARLLATIGALKAGMASLERLKALLETKIGEAKTAGHDVTALQAGVDQITAKIGHVHTAIGGLTAPLLVLAPNDYNTNRKALEPYRTALTSAQSDLKAARDSAKTVIDGLKAIKVGQAD